MDRKPYRIITGSAETVEAGVNSLCDEYIPLPWNFQHARDGTVVTVVLWAVVEMRKAAPAGMIPVAGNGARQ
jgi:hypothetical protein